MKATKYLSLAALALMCTLASCQSDDESTANSFARPANAVGINVSVGAMQTTRSNPASTDPDAALIFNQGDQISVSTNDQEAVLFQCTSTENQTWTEAVPNKFLLWTQPMLTFSAYYPVTTGTSMTTFTVPTDQSSVEKIALADYMTRQQNFSRPEGGSDINLKLERQMARVIVRISGFGSQYRDDQKTVDNVRIYSEASGIEDGNPTGSSTEIQPYTKDDGGQGSTFTALVVPGYGDSGARFIQLTDGENNTLLVKGIPELEAGNSYTFNLVVGKNRIEVASVTVQDWTTGETLNGGQAEEGSATLVTAITLNKTETLLGVGNTETLSVSSVTPDNATDQTVTWSSDNTDVATVNATTGEVTAVAKGTANITATANDGSGVTATCAVTVTALAGVFVNGATLKMNNFMFMMTNGNAFTITYNGTGFSATPSGPEADNMTNNTVTVNGKKITVKCSNGPLVITWVFDTATDHYTYTASGPDASEDASNASSFLLNGTDITSQLTKD